MGQNQEFGLLNHEQKILETKAFPLHEFLDENGNQTTQEIQSHIKIPRNFLLEKYHASSFEVITKIRKAMVKFRGEQIKIDFSRCKDIDYSCIFLLLVILIEYVDYYEKLEKSFKVIKARPEVLIIPSKNDEVNVRLMTGYILPNANITQSFLRPFSALNFIRGQRSRKDYVENLKGPAATTIRKYINDNLLQHDFCLDKTNAAYLDGIISEVLNNAEDHSQFNTWYVSGNIFRSSSLNNETDDSVSELNLAFLNFGYSIFDGLESSKDNNTEIYGLMTEMFEQVKDKMTDRNNFTKEEMFTLYALQEGVSRLKYKSEDRGTGTMKFIKSFINLGDYCDKEKKLEPSLLVYSGKVFLKCDHEVRPSNIEGMDILALNKSNDLASLPEKSHLKELNNNFPGTFLVFKLYLNKRHLRGKFAS